MRRRTTRSDQLLLRTLLVAAVLVALSIVMVPLNVENDTLHNHHSPSSVSLLAQNTSSVPVHHEQHAISFRAPAVNVDDKYPLSDYHMVFSTGCSIFQDWQSYVFFYHAIKAGQQGHITRIVSGCNDKEKEALQAVWDEEIAPMAPGRLHLHHTPYYGRIKKGVNFKYFNKPKGMQHWMKTLLGYPENHAMHDDSIIILMDPDQILLRPFTKDFTHSSELWRLGPERVKDRRVVEHGTPLAQQYGFGIQWKRKTNLTHVFGGETPITKLNDREAWDFYAGVGPPYLATAKDMFAMVDMWAEIVARVHDDYPHLLAEMFGYNLAAAHLQLKHTVARSFMVSDMKAGGSEGWGLVDAVPNTTDVCHNFPQSELPHVLHSCQRYAVGKWFFGKYRVRKDFISCEAPLFRIPPSSILNYTGAHRPDAKDLTYKPKEVGEQAFVLCAMIDAMNDAAIYYKDNHCDKATANYEYNYTFFDDMRMPFEIPENEKASEKLR